jgi:hypothetical protein
LQKALKVTESAMMDLANPTQLLTIDMLLEEKKIAELNLTFIWKNNSVPLRFSN